MNEGGERERKRRREKDGAFISKLITSKHRADPTWTGNKLTKVKSVRAHPTPKAMTRAEPSQSRCTERSLERLKRLHLALMLHSCAVQPCFRGGSAVLMLFCFFYCFSLFLFLSTLRLHRRIILYVDRSKFLKSISCA